MVVVRIVEKLDAAAGEWRGAPRHEPKLAAPSINLLGQGGGAWREASRGARAAAHGIIGASGGLVEARSNDLRVQASSLGEAVEMADRHLGIKWRWGTSAAEPGLAGAVAGVPGRHGRRGEVDTAI